MLRKIVLKVSWQFIGNKAKGRISKRVFQENKARQIFRKNKHLPAYTTEHFLAPDRVRIGGKRCSFSRKIWRALFSWNTRFEIPPFVLLARNLK